MPSMSDFPAAGNMPSGKSWRWKINHVKEAFQFPWLWQWSTRVIKLKNAMDFRESPIQSVERWRDPTCWFACTRSSRCFGSHGDKKSSSSSPPLAHPFSCSEFWNHKKQITCHSSCFYTYHRSGSWHLLFLFIFCLIFLQLRFLLSQSSRIAGLMTTSCHVPSS